MSNTTKRLSERDPGQTLQHSYNEVDASITTSGFLTGKIGHKITQTVETTTMIGDTLIFEYLDNGVSLYKIKVIYTDNTYATMLSAERIS